MTPKSELTRPGIDLSIRAISNPIPSKAAQPEPDTRAVDVKSSTSGSRSQPFGSAGPIAFVKSGRDILVEHEGSSTAVEQVEPFSARSTSEHHSLPSCTKVLPDHRVFSTH